jgi:regulatory protein
LLSDERFVEARTRSLRHRFGAARIRFDLNRAGASAPLVEAAVREARVDELDRARRVWQQRFGEPAADAAGRARQGRVLLARGFEGAVVRRVLKEAGMAVPDEEIES